MKKLKKWLCTTLFVLNLLLIGAAVLLSAWYFFTDWRLLVSLVCLFVLLFTAWIQVNYYENIIEKALNPPMYATAECPWVVTDDKNKVIFKTKQSWEKYEVGDIIHHTLHHFTLPIDSIVDDNVRVSLSPWSTIIANVSNIRHATADEILRYIRDMEDAEDYKSKVW